MPAEFEGDAFSRLVWAIRHHVALIVVVVTATTLAVVAVAPPVPPDTYEASALVAAQQLEGIRPEHLPRMAQAIFEGNNVARTAVSEGDLPIEPNDLLRDHADLEVIEGTVVSRVNGVAEDPSLAERIADATANALVDELNRLGPGVGVFALQEGARLPTEPMARPFRPPPALLGLVGGLVFALGLVMLILLARRPVLHPHDAAQRSGLPLAAVLSVSQAGHFDDLAAVPGVAPLADRAFPERREAVTVAAAERRAVRSQVATLLARSVAAVQAVAYVPAKDRPGRRAVRLVTSNPRIDAYTSLTSARGHAGAIVLDGRGHESLADTPTRLGCTLLVAREGIGASRLQRAASRFRPDDTVWLVWVSPRAGRLRSALLRARQASRDTRGEDGDPTSVESAPAEPTRTFAAGVVSAREPRRSGSALTTDGTGGTPSSRRRSGS